MLRQQKRGFRPLFFYAFSVFSLTAEDPFNVLAQLRARAIFLRLYIIGNIKRVKESKRIPFENQAETTNKTTLQNAEKQIKFNALRAIFFNMFPPPKNMKTTKF